MIDFKMTLPIKSFLVSRIFDTSKNNIFFILASEEEAIKAYKQLLFFTSAASEVLYFPSLDTIPYDRVSPNLNILSQRATVLTNLTKDDDKKIVVTSCANLLTKLPTPRVFGDSFLRLYSKMPFSVEKLSTFLIKNGFNRNSVAIDSGEFAIRGDIVDLVLPNNKGYRINFNWNNVDSIRNYDVFSQISNSDEKELNICSASEVMLNTETINNFKSNYLKTFGVNHTNNSLYQSITNNKKYPGYELFLPLFYNELCSILDYLKEYKVIYNNDVIQSILEYESNYNDLYQSRVQSNKINQTSFYPAVPPTSFNFASKDLIETLSQNLHPDFKQDSNMFEPIKDLANLPNTSAQIPSGFIEILKQSTLNHNKILQEVNSDDCKNTTKIPIVFCSSRSNVERLKTILKDRDCSTLEVEALSNAKSGIVNITHVPLSQSFLTKQYLFISEATILGERVAKQLVQNSKRKLKSILTELDSFIEGELVVHKEHGIGKFLGVENIEVLGSKHDCLKILYAENNKLYVPIENIELVKKYGEHEAELDKLGNLSWQKRKSKLKNRITEIADKLLKIAGQRKLATTNPVGIDINKYNEFCKVFPYVETEDQLNAIHDIKNDLLSGQLMDRLICGDVGFGKTEVAMRAVYLVAADSNESLPQIAIISPTTILCKQHYLRFIERFKGFGFKVAELSRLISGKESKIIKNQLKSGKINIIIGTHALLSKDIEFHNLKLLIIDEEQHFGVSQKERLKELKHSIHVLSLSATPIPRTMQMSLVGLKDLSLITTPPIDRLPIRTTVMDFDPVIIKDALLREHFRGGKSFYVCPRIKDIANVEKKLEEMVPELKYKIVHGSMPAQKVDETMSEFYEGKFDILLSTTIIESGIDIAVANTIVIHKADMLGLSQLYQLRGRIGRGKIRGYAYLTLSNKTSTKYAMQRLEIIQTADTLGAGFSIASHDMDIRGFGNLVGEEQSGHVKEVGIELYQEMLDEAMSKLKGENFVERSDIFIPSINLKLPVFINEDYIKDADLRLGIYRRIGTLNTKEEVEHFIDEMVDRFGPIPTPFKNLLDVVKIKQDCSKLNIENLNSGEQGFVLRFRKNIDVSDLVFNFIKKHPKNTKITPDNKLIVQIKIDPNNIISKAKQVLNDFEIS